jgi:hypothetical protein
MTTWTSEELERIGRATELELASRRPDGALSPWTIMWVVRADDALYVRSAYGPGSAWYRRAQATGQGRIRAGAIERDVTFTDVPAAETPTHAAVDAAYHAKYDQYGPRIVGAVVGPDAAAVSIRLEALR